MDLGCLQLGCNKNVWFTIYWGEMYISFKTSDFCPWSDRMWSKTPTENDDGRDGGSCKGFPRKFQQTPGTYPRYPKTQIWKDCLHEQVVEGPGYVPGVCWSFLQYLCIPLPKVPSKKKNILLTLFEVKSTLSLWGATYPPPKKTSLCSTLK